MSMPGFEPRLLTSVSEPLTRIVIANPTEYLPCVRQSAFFDPMTKNMDFFSF